MMDNHKTHALYILSLVWPLPKKRRTELIHVAHMIVLKKEHDSIICKSDEYILKCITDHLMYYIVDIKELNRTVNMALKLVSVIEKIKLAS